MNPHLLRKFRQRRDVLGILPIVEGTRTILTCTRATAARYFDSTGTLQTAAINEKVFEYDPVTGLFLGLRRERARTNAIRNNTMVGASAGTPGTLPTNWLFQITSTTGLTSSVVGSGTENGINYLDFRLFGTAVGAGSWQMFMEGFSSISAATAQVWTTSVYWRMVSGSMTGLSASSFQTYEYTSVPAYIKQTGSNISAPTTGALNTQRQSGTVTLSGGVTTAFVVPALQMGIANGAAIDITLRIGMPQLELGASVTSVISTSSAAVTRAADIASITGANFTSFWNATQGTIVAQYLFNRTIGSGEFPTIVAANDGTTNNKIATYAFISTGNNRSSNTGSVAGVTQFDLGSASGTFNGASGTAHKLANAYAANDFAAAFDGSAVLTDTSGSLPTVDRMTLGNIAGGQFLNGWISSLQIYPVRLPDTTLQALSA